MISLLSSTKNKVFKAKRRFKYDQHMEIIELKKYVNNKIFKNYLKFAVVRNPYDQAISDYYDQSFRPEHIKYKNFDDYLDKRVNYFFYKNKRKFTINDKIMLDDVIKYETLEKDLKRILKKLKIKDNVQTLEAGDTLVGAINSASYEILSIDDVMTMENDPQADNLEFENNDASFLDLSETNPFGEP